MPHVGIKRFPRAPTDEQGTALVAGTSEVIIRHLQGKDNSASAVSNEVESKTWQGVWDMEITPQVARLVKKPGYSM